MSFNFEWPTFSGEFYENAINTLNVALNRGPKPKVIVGDIHVKELSMGTVVRRRSAHAAAGAGDPGDR